MVPILGADYLAWYRYVPKKEFYRRGLKGGAHSLSPFPATTARLLSNCRVSIKKNDFFIDFLTQVVNARR
jgi:hypothetical protein